MKEEIEETRKNIEIKIAVEDILDEIGVKITLKGYKYWVTAVILKLTNKYETMKSLYMDIAKKHKTTASKAERALRHAYENIKPKVQEYFKLNYKPNNSVFLECLIRKTELFVKQKNMSNERR